jgi:hypothetical protein
MHIPGSIALFIERKSDDTHYRQLVEHNSANCGGEGNTTGL